MKLKPVTPRFRTLCFRAAVILLLLSHVALLTGLSVLYTPRIDEVGHLPAGLDYWQTGERSVYAVNPPLPRLIASFPVWMAGWKVGEPQSRRVADREEFAFGQRFVARYGGDSINAWRLARLTLIPVSLIGAFAVFYVALRWGGRLCGLLSLALWACSPSILVNGSTVSADLYAAVSGLMAMLAFCGWLVPQSLPRNVLFRYPTTLLGIAIGLAVLTKFTWLLLYPLLPILYAADHLVFGRLDAQSVPQRGSTLRNLLSLLTAYFLSWCILVAGYGFERMFEPLGSFEFKSSLFAGSTDNRFRGTWADDIPVPFPATMIDGLDVQKADFDHGYRSYLLGEWKHGGWLHYYAVGLLVKTPITFWLLLLVGLKTILRDAPLRQRFGLVLLLSAFSVFAFVSMHTGFSHHVRYVLPALPPLLLLAGLAARSTSRRTRFVVLAGTLLFAVDSIWQYPNSQSFCTGALGGGDAGRNYLVDSNIDCGQDLYALRVWLDEHPEIEEPIGLLYFGLFDPNELGINFVIPPSECERPAGSWASNSKPKLPTDPEWVAVSASFLMGRNAYVAGSQQDQNRKRTNILGRCFSRFRSRTPDFRLGGSIYVFHCANVDTGGVPSEEPLTD